MEGAQTAVGHADTHPMRKKGDMAPSSFSAMLDSDRTWPTVWNSENHERNLHAALVRDAQQQSTDKTHLFLYAVSTPGTGNGSVQNTNFINIAAIGMLWETTLFPFCVSGTTGG